MTTSSKPTDVLPPPASLHPSSTLGGSRRAALVVATGLSVGCATSFAQGRLPGALDAFTNSASAWLLFAFLLGCLMRSPGGALAAGAATCIAELAGYYVTASARGFGFGESSMLALWIACAAVGGPLLAIAGLWWRTGATSLRHFAPLVLAACFAVEGLRYAVVLDDSAKATLWAVIALVIALGSLSLRLAAMVSARH